MLIDGSENTTIGGDLNFRFRMLLKKRSKYFLFHSFTEFDALLQFHVHVSQFNFNLLIIGAVFS